MTKKDGEAEKLRAKDRKSKKNKAQQPTMRPLAFLGISSYRDERDARRKSEYGNSHLWW